MAGEQEKCALIVPRRNFLIRALGFTAMGASVPVPVLALDTPESRLEHHIDGTIRELRAMHPEYDVRCLRNIMMYGNTGVPLTFAIDHREREAREREYQRERRALDARYGK